MDERRRYQRVSFACRVKVTPSSGGATFEAQCVDISLGGVGIASRTLVPFGQLATVAFPLKTAANQDIVEQVVGKVVRVFSDTDGHYLGIEFLEPLHPARNPALTRKVGGL